MNRLRPTALVIDDEPDIRELLELTLDRMDVNTITAENLTQARALLAGQRFDLCLTDMRLPDGNGIDLVDHIQKNYPDIPVAMITAHGNMEAAISALKTGAFDFVSKPVDLQVLRNLVSTALKLSNTQTKSTRQTYTGLLGSSEVIKHIQDTITKLARSQAPVHISGESGTGKELVARAIHDFSPRNPGPFVPVECSGLTETLFESELFGHEKGAFTGAQYRKDGLVDAARGGTLFLDEVGDIPLSMQVKLLRVLETGTFRRVGSVDAQQVDFRLVCATHRKLWDMVAAGTFREDLYYRISMFPIHLPALRERIQDLPVLIETHLARIDSPRRLRMHADTLACLQVYAFPGNVRELRNILERAVIMTDGDVILPEHLPEHLLCSGKGVSGKGASGEIMTLEEMERRYLRQVMAQFQGDRHDLARQLGVSDRTLYRKLNALR